MHVDVSTKILKPETIYEFDGTVTMYGIENGRRWIVNGMNRFDARDKSQKAREKIRRELADV